MNRTYFSCLTASMNTVHCLQSTVSWVVPIFYLCVNHANEWHLSVGTCNIWRLAPNTSERVTFNTAVFFVCYSRVFPIQNVLHVFSIVSICSCFPKPSLSLSSSLPLSLVFYFCIFHLRHPLFHTFLSFFYCLLLCFFFFLSLAFSVGMTRAGSRD